MTSGIQPHDTGMVFEGPVTFKEWERKGQEMAKVISLFQNNIRWWIGDWIIYGESHFPDKYSQALEGSMYAIGTLRNAVYTCRNVPQENRVPTLSFEHHYEVAKLSPEEQKRKLADADIHHWTVRQLRASVAGREIPTDRVVPDKLEIRPKFSMTWEDFWAQNEAELKIDPVKKSCKRAWDAARRIE